MAGYVAHFDADKDATREKLTKLISSIGTVDWSGDSGTFAGTGMAGGVKGKVALVEKDGGTDVDFSYSLPLKLKAFGGKVDSQIRGSLEKAGATIK